MYVEREREREHIVYIRVYIYLYIYTHISEHLNRIANQVPIVHCPVALVSFACTHIYTYIYIYICIQCACIYIYTSIYFLVYAYINIIGHYCYNSSSIPHLFLWKGCIYRLGIHLDRMMASARGARLKLPFGESEETKQPINKLRIRCTCVCDFYVHDIVYLVFLSLPASLSASVCVSLSLSLSLFFMSSLPLSFPLSIHIYTHQHITQLVTCSYTYHIESM